MALVTKHFTAKSSYEVRNVDAQSGVIMIDQNQNPAAPTAHMSTQRIVWYTDQAALESSVMCDALSWNAWFEVSCEVGPVQVWSMCYNLQWTTAQLFLTAITLQLKCTC